MTTSTSSHSRLAFRASTSADAEAIHDVWARAVKATHDFLPSDQFDEISKVVRNEYAPKAELTLAVLDGRIVGFLGVTQSNVDGLFVDPDVFGRGVGRALIEFARKTADSPLTVDVNEQNAQACGFYKHMGFQVIGRSETDEEGRPFPLLHMREGG